MEVFNTIYRCPFFAVSGVASGLSRKDELYNDLVDWFGDIQLLFSSAKSEGSYVTQVLYFKYLIWKKV